MTIVVDAAQPTVNRLWSMGNTPAVHGRKQLHAQAHSEDRNIASGAEKSWTNACTDNEEVGSSRSISNPACLQAAVGTDCKRPLPGRLIGIAVHAHVDTAHRRLLLCVVCLALAR